MGPLTCYGRVVTARAARTHTKEGGTAVTAAAAAGQARLPCLPCLPCLALNNTFFVSTSFILTFRLLVANSNKKLHRDKKTEKKLSNRFDLLLQSYLISSFWIFFVAADLKIKKEG